MAGCPSPRKGQAWTSRVRQRPEAPAGTWPDQRRLFPGPRPLADPGNVSRGQNCRLFCNVEDGDRVTVDPEEDPDVRRCPHDVDAGHLLELFRIPPHYLVGVPAFQVAEPGVYPSHAVRV